MKIPWFLNSVSMIHIRKAPTVSGYYWARHIKGKEYFIVEFIREEADGPCFAVDQRGELFLTNNEYEHLAFWGPILPLDEMLGHFESLTPQ